MEKVETTIPAETRNTRTIWQDAAARRRTVAGRWSAIGLGLFDLTVFLQCTPAVAAHFGNCPAPRTPDEAEEWSSDAAYFFPSLDLERIQLVARTITQ